MANEIITTQTIENQIWFEAGTHAGSAFIHREVLASTFSGLAAALTGEKRETVILCAISVGLKVVRRDR